MQKGTVPPRIVNSGPVKERIITGRDLDLRKLPVLVHSEEDGGPYIGSAMCVTRDPDTGIQNVAMLRMQIQDRNRTGTAFAPRHSWMHYQKYEARNEPMPMAAVIGHHPLLDIATNSSVPYGVDEFHVAGSLLGEPLEMVRCETIDLMVPAHAEIVIEGVIPPGIREDEGPFGEFQCYYLTRTRKCPVFEVKAITMRRDALYRHIQATPSTVEHQALVSLPMEAHLWQRIKDVDGYIDLKDVHVPPWGACFIVLIKFTPRLEEQAKSVLMAALSSSYAHPKIAIALDDDIDLTDPRDVFWAVATELDPSHDLLQIPHARIHSLDPSGRLVTAPGAGHQRVGGKLGSRNEAAHMQAQGPEGIRTCPPDGVRTNQPPASAGRHCFSRRFEMTRLQRLFVAIFILSVTSAPVGARDLVVGYSVLAASAAQLWVTQEAGIFDRHGLKVKPIFVQGGTRTTQALIAGDLDVAYVAPPAVMSAAASGAKLVFVTGVTELCLT